MMQNPMYNIIKFIVHSIILIITTHPSVAWIEVVDLER